MVKEQGLECKNHTKLKITKSSLESKGYDKKISIFDLRILENR